MEKKTTVATKETKVTKAKNPINPKNKPVISAKKQETRTTADIINAAEAKEAAEKKAAKAKKSTAKKVDAKKQEVATVLNPPAPQFSKEDIARYDELITKLRDAWSAAQKATMATAFVLFEVYNSGLYRIDGFKNIYEFGSEMFGQSKSTVNRLINIVDRFGAQIENGKPIESITEKYSGYSQSQLEAMLGHTDDELSKITPEMSVREIKKVLKAEDDNAGAKEKDKTAGGGLSDGSDEQDEQKPINEKATLIWGFDNVTEWDNLCSADPESEFEFKNLLATIRKCLTLGHKVRILDVFEAK